MNLIDTNIFVEIYLKQKNMKKCEIFLRKISENEIQGIITDFSIDSVCILMENYHKKTGEIRLFLLSLLGFVGLKIYFTTIIDRILATQLMEKHDLDFDDALTLQAMYSNNVKEIVSFDKHFDKIKEIKRVEP